MHARQITLSAEIMKKESNKHTPVSARRVGTSRRSTKAADEMLPHYDFDYKQSRPNRFAKRLSDDGTIAVVLDPDVANVFRSAEAVNKFLRSAISAMPKVESSKKKAS
jgi:hypothetical protein